MKKKEIKKGLAIGIIVLFFVAGITTNLSGKDVFATNEKELEEKYIQMVTCNLDTETFYPTDDTSVKEDKPYTNYGTSYLVVRNKYGAGGSPLYEDDILIKFDISDISAGAIITSATINLYYFSWLQNNAGENTLTLYRVTRDWDEDTVTWNTRPSYTPSVTSSAVVPGSPGFWMEWNVTSEVQDFVDKVKTNYGWQIMDKTYWGTFDIPAARFIQKEEGGNIAYLEVELYYNQPPGVPNIDGTASGKAGVSYTYTATSTDPNGDQIWYWFDWDDDANTGWVGPYTSGSPASKSHIWNAQGDYHIKVKTKDSYDAESLWGTLDVTMPVNQHTYSFPLLQRLLERFPNMFPILRHLFDLE